MRERHLAELRILYGVPVKEICKKYKVKEEILFELIALNDSKKLSREFNAFMRKTIIKQIKVYGISINEACKKFGATKIQIEKWIEWQYPLHNQTIRYKYSAKMKNQIIKLKLQGMTYKEINQLRKVPISLMARWLSEHYMKHPEDRHHKYYDNQIKDYSIGLRLDGMKYKEIHELTKVPIATLNRWVKEKRKGK
jgi:transposase